MPNSVYQDVVACPANTPVTAPVEQALSVVDAIIPRKVTITIPDGHAGLTGIAVAFGHNAVIPSNKGGFISGNDWTFPFDLSDYPNGVSWSVFVVNLDTIAHTWQVIFEGDTLPDTPGSVAAPPPSEADVMAAAMSALGGP